MLLYVNTYLCGRAYGGPEEGGWWYDYGLPVPEMCGEFKTMKAARQFMTETEAQIAEINAGNPPIDSVNCEGVYEVRLEKTKPEGWPIVKPCYA